ncbi:hypothetical protein [Methylobacterium sp. 391_Methyba4]|uniref:hypothetical protein n=1 Tax=Methylobacterium sp. 391_Methyba4 TaxID=3038924 RepID=UPI00241C2441|nr:hypothetical protein [Methylobacterium sp. 391_Methyba4]WFS07611.1 hypothetical protein P9K36_30400 [Methylobacterium sp. 391_Methyba4]
MMSNKPIKDLDALRKRLIETRREKVALGQSIVEVQSEIEAVDRAREDEVATIRNAQQRAPGATAKKVA